MEVKKRNGAIENFDPSKIAKVISKTAKNAKEEISEDTLDKIVKYVTKEVAKLKEPILVKDIRKSVENALMKFNKFDTARVYIEECRKRECSYLAGIPVYEEMVTKLTGHRNDKQNANVDEETFGGKIGEAADVMLKNRALDFMINPKFAKLHNESKNYIHDLSRWSVGQHNCLSFPIDNVTSKASTIKIPKALRVPGGIETLCQIILVHLQSQSQDQFGGVSITHLDWTAVPFIRKSFWRFYNDAINDYNLYTGSNLENPIEKKDREKVSIEDERYKQNEKIYESVMVKIKKATLQAVEALLHNANTLQSRSGNQLPFTSVNYGTCTLKEGQILCEELLKTWEEGIGELKLTSIFPCGIFQLKDGVNTKEGDPNYYLFQKALQVLAKRDYPNFTNCDWSVDLSGFQKSQAVKEKALKSLSEEELRELSKLPIEIQNKLGFTIVED